MTQASKLWSGGEGAPLEVALTRLLPSALVAMTPRFLVWPLTESPGCLLSFVVSNGRTSRNGSFEISVEMVDRILPSLSANRGLLVPQGTTVILGPDCLALSDPDTPPEALTFALVQPPQYGKLLLAGAPLASGSTFTQRNIQEVQVAYEHNGGPSQIDRFGFSASDSTAQGFLLDGRLQAAPVFFTIQVPQQILRPSARVPILQP